MTDVAGILSAFGVGATIGSVVTLILKHHLHERSEGHKRQVETDRATYQERITRLIASNLCAFIRSDRYRDGERDELAHLVQELSDGAHRERFLDPKVHAAWLALVRSTAQYGWRRLTNVITEQDISSYTRDWEAWLTASRESFGPLPESDRPLMRRSAEAAAMSEAA